MARARQKVPRSAPPLAARVFAQLADGRFHSGEALARDLRVSRSAVWKAVGALKVLGATLEAVRNRGYRLSHTGEPLAAGKIRGQLDGEVRTRVRQLDTTWSIDSTITNWISLRRSDGMSSRSASFRVGSSTRRRPAR